MRETRETEPYLLILKKEYLQLDRLRKSCQFFEGSSERNWRLVQERRNGIEIVSSNSSSNGILETETTIRNRKDRLDTMSLVKWNLKSLGEGKSIDSRNTRLTNRTT